MRELLNLFEAADPEIQNHLKDEGYDDLKPNGNIISVLVQIPDKAGKNDFRNGILADLMNRLSKFKPEYRNDKPNLSSLGYIGFENNPTMVIVKDVGKQGDKSSGVDNEVAIGSMLQSVIEKYHNVDITFVDPRGLKLHMNNVTSVELTGKDVAKRKKADIILHSKNSRLPVSIKQVDADAWESADSLFGKKARHIVDKLVAEKVVSLNKLSDAEGYKLSKEIVIQPTEEEAMDAIFGSDLSIEGGIVIQTFKPQHFVQEGNKVNIECYAVIRNKNDIPEDKLMVWLIRNNAGRPNKTMGIRGLRLMAATMHRAMGAKGNKDVILTDPDGNVISGGKPENAPTTEKPTNKSFGDENALGRKRRK